MILFMLASSCSNKREEATGDCFNIHEMSDSICSLTLVVEEVYGSQVIMNNDTISGYYAQVIQCNESAVIYGWTIEDVGNVIDNRSIIWLPYWSKDKNYKINIRALDKGERQFVKNAIASLADTYYEYPHHINDAQKLKLFVNNKKIADGFLLDFKAFPSELQETIKRIIYINGQLKTIDGNDIRQLLNNEFSYSYDF